MKSALSQEYLEALACPSCKSYKLLLTKEKIVICSHCLNGYKLLGEVPDFRLENAISFKKKSQTNNDDKNAVLTVMLGKNKSQTVHVKMGHCVVLGRKIDKDFDGDLTFVGKPQSPMYAPLDPGNQKIVERFMSRDRKKTPNVPKDSIFDDTKAVLGQFMRDPDFLLSEQSVSRSHAVIYQDEKGVHIIDLVSKNGTYVNGYEIESTKLKNNDIVSLGTASLKMSMF